MLSTTFRPNFATQIGALAVVDIYGRSLIVICCQVRDSVMTRVSLSWSQDNEVTIAGLGMLSRLGLTRKDLQVYIDYFILPL